jgi:hypothetical protein
MGMGSPPLGDDAMDADDGDDDGSGGGGLNGSTGSGSVRGVHMNDRFPGGYGAYATR